MAIAGRFEGRAGSDPVPKVKVGKAEEEAAPRLRQHVLESIHAQKFIAENLKPRIASAVDPIVGGLQRYGKGDPEKLWNSILKVAEKNAERMGRATMEEGELGKGGLYEFFTVGLPGELLRKGRFRALVDFGIFQDLAQHEPEFVEQKLEECLPKLEGNVRAFLMESLGLEKEPGLKVTVVDLKPLGAPGRGNIGAMRLQLAFSEKAEGRPAGLLVKQLAGSEEKEDIGAKRTVATHIEWTAHQILKAVEPKTYSESHIRSCEGNKYVLMTIYADETGKELPTYYDILKTDERTKGLFDEATRKRFLSPLKPAQFAEFREIMAGLSREQMHKLFYGLGKALAYDYLLGIHDRHTNNALLDKDFNRIEIDFGKALGGMDLKKSLRWTWAVISRSRESYLKNLGFYLRAERLHKAEMEKGKIEKEAVLKGMGNEVEAARKEINASVERGFRDACASIYRTVKEEMENPEKKGVLHLLSEPPRVVLEDLVNEMSQPIEIHAFSSIKTGLEQFASRADMEAAIEAYWKVVGKARKGAIARFT